MALAAFVPVNTFFLLRGCCFEYATTAFATQAKTVLNCKTYIYTKISSRKYSLSKPKTTEKQTLLSVLNSVTVSRLKVLASVFTLSVLIEKEILTTTNKMPKVSSYSSYFGLQKTKLNCTANISLITVLKQSCLQFHCSPKYNIFLMLRSKHYSLIN